MRGRGIRDEGRMMQVSPSLGKSWFLACSSRSCFFYLRITGNSEQTSLLGNKEKVPKENNTILYSIEKCINHDKKVKNTAVLPSLLAYVGKGYTYLSHRADRRRKKEGGGCYGCASFGKGDE